MLPANIEILNPHWLWLVPVLLVWFIYIYLQRSKLTFTGLLYGKLEDNVNVRHPLANLFKQKVKDHTPLLIPGLLLKWLIFSLLALSLSQPVLRGEKLPEPPRERDIVFIIDTSVSMVLRDYLLDGQRIDRMSLLKGFLDRFIQQLKGERISLIVFGDSAYTFVPLSRDQQLLRHMLARIETGMAGRFKAVGEGIALAVKQAESQKKDKKKRHRILVLFTDANQPTGDIKPMVAAELAKQAGLPLYTISIGAVSYGAEEKRRSGLLYHPADVALLKKMAQLTGAENYLASNVQALERAVDAVSSSEANEQKTVPRFYRQALYHWPLILAVALIIITQLNGLFRNSQQ